MAPIYTAALEAVVEEAEVLAAAFCSPCTFMLLKVSMGGVSPHADVVCVRCPRGRCCITPVIEGEAA